jgi:polysaccharide transporter, PST family
MSQPHNATDSRSSNARAWQADSFGNGLLALLISNVLQRGLGLARNLIFCWLMLDTELGVWSLIQTFVFLAAPLAVLGLPGSYARYIEHYRQQGQLARFLVQTGTISALGTLAVVATLLAVPGFFSHWITGAEQSFASMLAICFCLIAIIAFISLAEVASGLRQIRLVSKMHFVNSLAFTFVGLAALSISSSWQALVIAFGCAHLIGCLPMLTLCRHWSTSDTTNAKTTSISDHATTNLVAAKASTGTTHAWSMWSRLLRYAASIWLMNLLINLFDVLDRYMLLYWIDASTEYSQALLGQYHAARIFPLLLLSLGSMLSNMLLPYVTADWEAGHKDQAGARVTDSLKLCSLVLWLASLAFMIPAPWIFDIGLQHRYQLGLEVQPACLLITIWGSLFLIAQNYLLCAERGRTVVLICALGLAFNAALNVLLIPSLELQGAVTATWLANGLLLTMVLLAIRSAGCKLDRTLWLTLFAPASLVAGVELSALTLSIMLVLAARTDWLISSADRLRIEGLLKKYERFIPQRLRRYGVFIPTIENATR